MAEQDDLESWDIERDLHFLIATDEQLETELDHMCSLLIDASSDASVESNASPSVQPTQQPTNRKGLNSQPVSRRKKEMFELQRQVKVLKDELETAKYQAAMQREMSCWEKAARVQLYHKRKALQENEMLREAADGNNYLIAKMKSLLGKRPRLCEETTSDQWKEYKLAASTSLRAAGIHAIADRQFSRLDTALINAGVWRLREDRTSVRPKAKDGGKTFCIEVIRHLKLDAPKDVIAKAAWSVFSDPEMQFPVPPGGKRTIEMIDPCTLYEMNEVPTPDGVICHSNIIRKAYMDEDRHVMLSRTVLHDALAPQMMHRDVEDESSWIVLENDDTNPQQCYFTFLLHVQSDLTEIRAVKPVDTDVLLEKFTQITLETTGQGLLPKESQEAAWKAFPPSMEAFSKNGKEFGKYLLQVIKQAVKSFHESKPSSCPSE
ncbi:unnamed protein product [Aphanomyces euteiches]